MFITDVASKLYQCGSRGMINIKTNSNTESLMPQWLSRSGFLAQGLQKECKMNS